MFSDQDTRGLWPLWPLWPLYVDSTPQVFSSQIQKKNILHSHWLQLNIYFLLCCIGTNDPVSGTDPGPVCWGAVTSVTRMQTHRYDPHPVSFCFCPYWLCEPWPVVVKYLELFGFFSPLFHRRLSSTCDSKYYSVSTLFLIFVSSDLWPQQSSLFYSLLYLNLIIILTVGWCEHRYWKGHLLQSGDIMLLYIDYNRCYYYYYYCYYWCRSQTEGKRSPGPTCLCCWFAFVLLMNMKNKF